MGFSWPRTQTSVGEYSNMEHLPLDQSCHHEVLVERHSGQSHYDGHERRLLLEDRSVPYHYSKPKSPTREDVSDHSPSTLTRQPLATNSGAGFSTERTTFDLHRRATFSVQ